MSNNKATGLWPFAKLASESPEEQETDCKIFARDKQNFSMATFLVNRELEINLLIVARLLLYLLGEMEVRYSTS